MPVHEEIRPNQILAKTQLRVSLLDPLRDSRWLDLVRNHPRASVFHTPAWLQALHSTYGYEPVVFTTAPENQELTNGIVFCQIQNWVAGRRMVSLPFSDHCDPLVGSEDELELLLSFARKREKWARLEIRSLLPAGFEKIGFLKGKEYHYHKLDLRPSLDELFRKFHKSCVQRKIRKAERERLTCEEGRSEMLLDKFYGLLLLTRRRHQLPAQPLRWFRNLATCFGENLTIRVASKDGQPVASILTLQHKDTFAYKYGCSDEKFHHLGGMPLLFWQALQSAKNCLITEFDLGRSDLDNSGLAAFKEHLGAKRSELCYFRTGNGAISAMETNWKIRTVRRVFSHAPAPLVKIAGNFLYRYVG